VRIAGTVISGVEPEALNSRC